MAAERFAVRAVVLLVLLREQQGKCQVLLQQRQNTGFADGMWECAASGHVEGRESLKAAMAREAREELGIEIAEQDLSLCGLIHKYIPTLDDGYICCYFTARKYQGVPQANEPQKCSAVTWFDVDDLPPDLIEDRAPVIQQRGEGLYYRELDWDLA